LRVGAKFYFITYIGILTEQMLTKNPQIWLAKSTYVYNRLPEGGILVLLYAVFGGKISHFQAQLKYVEIKFILENIHVTIVFICFQPRVAIVGWGQTS